MHGRAGRREHGRVWKGGWKGVSGQSSPGVGAEEATAVCLGGFRGESAPGFQGLWLPVAIPWIWRGLRGQPGGSDVPQRPGLSGQGWAAALRTGLGGHSRTGTAACPPPGATLPSDCKVPAKFHVSSDGPWLAPTRLSAGGRREKLAHIMPPPHQPCGLAGVMGSNA